VREKEKCVSHFRPGNRVCGILQNAEYTCAYLLCTHCITHTAQHTLQHHTATHKIQLHILATLTLHHTHCTTHTATKHCNTRDPGARVCNTCQRFVWRKENRVYHMLQNTEEEIAHIYLKKKIAAHFNWEKFKIALICYTKKIGNNCTYHLKTIAHICYQKMEKKCSYLLAKNKQLHIFRKHLRISIRMVHICKYVPF